MKQRGIGGYAGTTEHRNVQGTVSIHVGKPQARAAIEGG